MKYSEFLAAESFEKADLLAFAHGTLIEDAPEAFAARLPAPPNLRRILPVRRCLHCFM